MHLAPTAQITIVWSSPGIKRVHAVVKRNLITYNYEEYANSNSVDPTLFYVIEQIFKSHGRKVLLDIDDQTQPLRINYERND